MRAAWTAKASVYPLAARCATVLELSPSPVNGTVSSDATVSGFANHSGRAEKDGMYSGVSARGS